MATRIGPAFRGRAFQDATIPLSVLPELAVYQSIVTMVGRELWLEENPDSKNVPKKVQASLDLALRGVERGSALPVLECAPIAGQVDLFPLAIRAAERADALFAAACRGDPIAGPRRMLAKMGVFGARLERDASAKFADAPNWTDEVRARVAAMARAKGEPGSAVVVGSIVALSDMKFGKVTIAPLGTPRFEVPYGSQRDRLHRAFHRDNADGKPFIRCRVYGVYFGKMLERATAIDEVEIVHGPEFEHRWAYLSSLPEVSGATKRAARAFIADVIVSGAMTRPYLYADEDGLVLEWPSTQHGAIIVRCRDEARSLLTTTTRLEEEDPSPARVAELAAEHA